MRKPTDYAVEIVAAELHTYYPTMKNEIAKEGIRRSARRVIAAYEKAMAADDTSDHSKGAM